MRLIIPLTLALAVPAFTAPLSTAVYISSGAWTQAILAAPNMAIEYTDSYGFADNDNMGSNEAVFSQGRIQSGTGSWGGGTWTYDQPMYGFGFDVDMDSPQAELLGISNGVASVYIPRGWLYDPMEFFGFTSATPFTSVALTFGTGVMPPPEGLPPYPSTDYYYEMRDQYVAYDPPAASGVPEPMSFWLCGAGLLLTAAWKTARSGIRVRAA